MRFTLLGSGTSTGVPVPGCRCPVCTSQDPRNHRNRTSAFLERPGGPSILIDASSDLRHQALKWGVSRVDAVVYTHAHADHILGTDDLRSFNFVNRNRIRCFGTAPTLSGIRRMFSYVFESDASYEGGLLAQLDLHEVTNEEPFLFDGIQFVPFPLTHGRTTVTGFRVGELGYATDFKRISERGVAVLEGVKYLFLDGLRYEQHATHMTIDEAVELAAKLRATKTYLIHMTHSVEHAEVNAKLPQGVELGYDGLTLEFDETAVF